MNSTLLNVISFSISVLFFVCLLAVMLSVVKAIRSKRFKLKMPSLTLILLSLLLGVVITGLYTGQEVFVRDNTCAYFLSETPQGFTQGYLTDSCTNLAYGYPRKFISGQTHIEVTKQAAENLTLKDIDVGSTISLSAKSLIFDMTVWTTASFVVLYAVYIWNNSGKSAAKKSKTKNRR